ncbi:MAG: Tim44 domain-containing protein [Pseudomonadota bacterium]|nr:Tim44 domain-containing protein [Pseudomonadota bacterium]
MEKRSWMKHGAFLVIALFLAVFVLELDAYARVGGGRSFGSRGSRSAFSPSKPSPSQPATPYRGMTSPSPASPQAPQRGGLLGSLGAGLAGGLLGGLLFSSLGFGHGGGFGGGIGLFDIILIGGILYGIYWFLKRRRQQEAAAASPAAFYRDSGPQTPVLPVYGQSAGEAPRDDHDLDRRQGISHIRQMDPQFDEAAFRELCTDNFFNIQGAWANRDMASARSLLTDEMFRILQGEADQMRRDGKINKLENIAVRGVEIAEAWQEEGRDYITVRFLANLLDYTVSERGDLLGGSKTDPVKFEEYWTFVRPVGNNPWQLTAIDQGR